MGLHASNTESVSKFDGEVLMLFVKLQQPKARNPVVTVDGTVLSIYTLRPLEQG